MRVSGSFFVLIDNNRISRYFNKYVLENSGFANEILTFDNCLEAVNFLKNPLNSNSIPEVILLDLYTPKMNGWEFLQEYSKTVSDVKLCNVVLLLQQNLLKEEERVVSACAFNVNFLDKNLNKYSEGEIYSVLRQKNIAM